MSKIRIQIKGVSVELVLGNYMPTDSTIMQNWEEFYHYNDLIHVSELIASHINEVEIFSDNKSVFRGRVPASAFVTQKSFCPVMVNRALYLRTECVEEATYFVEFEVDDFDLRFLKFETQDYDLLFKVSDSFVSNIKYKDKTMKPEWQSGNKPVGNICLLCRFENGFLVPVYDAIKKTEIKIS